MIRIVALLVALAFVSACKPVVNTVKDCSSETAAGLIDDVNTALSTKDYEGALAGLVVEWGSCVVTKTVEHVVASLFKRAQLDTLEALKKQRGEAWLAAHKSDG